MRKEDSGWRDEQLNDWHVAKGFPCPAAGMTLPMIEYDRGLAVGLVSYIRRGGGLPTGREAAAAYGALRDLDGQLYGAPLPFLTAMYDPRNWAVRVFPHNKAADALLADYSPDLSHWYPMSERDFAGLLYDMRGRRVPDMFGMGVEWSESAWSHLEPLGGLPDLPFPCADMSARRRAYEPRVAAPMRFKVPCLDIDLAVVDQDNRLAMVVDYKRMGALCDTAGTNANALSSLVGNRRNVPAFMTRYFGQPGSYGFETAPLNKNARSHLAYALGAADAVGPLARTVAGEQWIRLSEPQWLDVLKVARDV